MDILPEIPVKTCTKCLVKYPATAEYWNKQKRGKYGFTSNCKPCRAVYRESNRERTNTQQTVYRKVNRAKEAVRVSAWERGNPDKVKAKYHRRRARKMASTEHFTATDLELQYRSQCGKCWHCGKPLNNEYHADHLIPLSQGGSNASNNVVCSCAPCNQSKSDKTVAQWKGRLF